jgi:DNA-binding protein YbaB
LTEILTPHQLNKELVRLSRLLDQAQQNLEQRSHDWAKKEWEYRVARANAYLAASGTVDARKSSVDKAVKEEGEAAHLAEALKVAAVEGVRNLRQQLSAFQSLAAAVRSEIEMAGRYAS